LFLYRAVIVGEAKDTDYLGERKRKVTKVYCSVDSCRFWEDNQCTAGTIWVKNNPSNSADEFNEEYADELGIAYFKHFSATTSAQTCCETMQPQKEG